MKKRRSIYLCNGKAFIREAGKFNKKIGRKEDSYPVEFECVLIAEDIDTKQQIIKRNRSRLKNVLSKLMNEKKLNDAIANNKLMIREINLKKRLGETTYDIQ